MGISFEDEVKLVRKYQRGHGRTKTARAAATELLRVHHGFICGQAKKFAIDFDDAVQIARLGFLRGALTFDPKRKFRLLTYCVNWIRVYLYNFSMSSRSLLKIGTTDWQRRMWATVPAAYDYLTKKFKAEPTREQVAEFLGEPIERLDIFLQHNYSVVPLDRPLSADDSDSATLKDFIVDEKPLASDQLDVHEEQKFIRQLVLLTPMSEIEKFIVHHRVMAEKPLTLKQVGERFNVSREWVRQRELAVLRRLKSAVLKHPERHMLTG